MNSLFKRIVCILLCLCMTAGTFLLLTSCGKGGEDSPEGDQTDNGKITVLRALTLLEKGKRLSNSDFEEVVVDAASVPEGALTSADQVTSKYLNTILFPGDYVFADKVSDTKDSDMSADSGQYIVVTDYITSNKERLDSYEIIQKIIDDNPNKTIYFPDGEYIISSSLCTYGGADKAVSLLLADGAVIKASGKWKSDSKYDSLICLGAKDGIYTDSPANDVSAIGSYYSLMGGTLDGNGKANGVSMDGGRETLIKNVNIKNVKIGIRVNIGINNKSSDMDIDDVTIMCDGSEGSIGIDIWGYDNTFTNIRIYDARIGINFPGYAYGTSSETYSGGNAFHNVQMYYTLSNPNGTVGFNEGQHGNFYYQCYIENYAIAYSLAGYTETVDSCVARWTSSACTTQTAFRLFGSFRTIISSCKADFFDASSDNAFIKADAGGNGKIEAPMFNKGLCDDDQYTKYLRGSVVW